MRCTSAAVPAGQVGKGLALQCGHQALQRAQWGDVAGQRYCHGRNAGADWQCWQCRQRCIALRCAGLQQAVQVQRPAGLGASARQAHAAKRLHADHRANHVAVDVNVAGLHLLRDLGNGFVNAAVDAKRQAVAGGVDGVQHLRQLLAAVAQYMQNWAEHLTLQALYAINFDNCWQDEVAYSSAFVARQARHALALRLQLRDVLLDLRARLGVYHRADVGVHSVGVAHDPFAHRLAHHVDDALGAFFLQAQQAQRRAALASRVKRRSQHIADQLLGQCRRVGHQRVLSAGFGNQRNALALRAQALRQLLRNQPGDFGRAGKQHAGHLRVRHQRGAHGFTVTG